MKKLMTINGRTWFDLTLKEKKVIMKSVIIESKKIMDEVIRIAEATESLDKRSK